MSLFITKQSKENFNRQAQAIMQDYSNKGAATFQELIKQLQVFKNISQTTEQKIDELQAKRRGLYSELEKNQQDLSARTVELMKLDDRLLVSYKDYAAMQALHREKLIDQVEMLAKELGVQTEENNPS